MTKVEGLWKSYEGALQKLNVSEIAKQNTVVLREMNKAVKQYEVASILAGIKGAGKVINIAGRQRMLTQKMAKEVFLIAAEIDTKKNQKGLKSTIKLFDSSLNALRNGDAKMKVPATSNATISKQLDIVAGLWKDYKGMLEQVTSGGKPDNGLLKKIADINPKILKEMHKAVGMFEKDGTAAH